MKKNIKVGAKKNLVENLLLIEGITRSGKFLLSNVINGLKGVEPIQYSVVLEEIPFLTSQKLIDKETAKEILKCEIDIRCYETLIGRNLNQRIFDKSSIFNNPDYTNLLKRTKNPNTDKLVKVFEKEKNYSPFVLHESLSQIEIFFEAFPKTKCISIKRDPITLVYSWYRRGLGKRWGNDPLFFQIPFSNKKEQNFPWFILGVEEEYFKLNEMDRVILSIKQIINKTKASNKTLSPKYKRSILKVNFEDLLKSPTYELKKISNFLEKPIRADVNKILKQEGLPANVNVDNQKKLKEIEKLATKKYFKQLLQLEH